MKKIMLILIETGILFLGLNSTYAQDVESEIKKNFSERQEAIDKKDYKSILKYKPRHYKKEHTPEEDLKLGTDKAGAVKEKIEEIILISPDRAFIKTTPALPFVPAPFNEGYYVVNEDGQWTFDALSFRYIRVLNELNDIMNLIFIFYKTEGRLPENMEELIRMDDKIKGYYDLFADMKSPYRYVIAGDNSCKVYSVGPDNQDNNGGELYKPQKGVLSAGDVVLTGEIF